jgi:WSC domain
MAGTEYGGQCFCGNSLSTSTKLDDSQCAMPCEGDGSQTCGGSLSLSVYTTAASKARRAEGHLRRHLQRVNV